MGNNQEKGSHSDSPTPGHEKKHYQELGDAIEGMRAQLLSMFKFAKDKGLSVSKETVECVRYWQTREMGVSEDAEVGLSKQLAQLNDAHKELAEKIKPSTPGQVHYLMSYRDRWPRVLRWLGPVPLVRSLILAAAVSLVGFIAFTLLDQGLTEAGAEIGPSADTTSATQQVEPSDLAADSSADTDLVEAEIDSSEAVINREGEAPSAAVENDSSQLVGFKNDTDLSLPLLLRCFFAAALGAAFVLLYQAQRFLKTDTFDPKFNADYLVQFVLGLIAGIIISTALADPLGVAAKQYGRPGLALVGGFSVEAVHRLLQRFARILSTMVGPDDKEAQRLKVEAAQREAKGFIREALSDAGQGIIEVMTRLEGKADVGDALTKLKEMLAGLKERSDS